MKNNGHYAENLVVTELTRQTHVAVLAPKNANHLDVIACDRDCTRCVCVEVKSMENSTHFTINSKSLQGMKPTPNLFFVFVNIKRKDFYIVNSQIVIDEINAKNPNWQKQFSVSYQPKPNALGAWAVLGLGGASCQN